MEYSIIFGIMMGVLFASLATNKSMFDGRGGFCYVILGTVFTVLFWAFFNEFYQAFTGPIAWWWINKKLWLEAAATAFIAAVIGQNVGKAIAEKNGSWRYIVPASLFLVSIIL